MEIKRKMKAHKIFHFLPMFDNIQPTGAVRAEASSLLISMTPGRGTGQEDPARTQSVCVEWDQN